MDPVDDGFFELARSAVDECAVLAWGLGLFEDSPCRSGSGNRLARFTTRSCKTPSPESLKCEGLFVGGKRSSSSFAVASATDSGGESCAVAIAGAAFEVGLTSLLNARRCVLEPVVARTSWERVLLGIELDG